MRTLAITGASGFLGRYLISECITQGHFKLRLLTRNRDAFAHLKSDKITICEGDLLDLDTLADFISLESTLVHLAYINNKKKDNIEAVSNLLTIVKQKRVKRFIHCSTAVVVGFKARGVITEETKPAPRGEYQKTKYQIEKMLRSELFPNIELAILRPTEIIGLSGQGLNSMINRLQYGNPYKNFIYHSLLKSRRFNYVSIYNVVAAILLLASTPIAQNSEVYNISDDDDPDNNYESVERIISSHLNCKKGHQLDFGIPKWLLSFLFRLIPNISPSDRIYSHFKICGIGYRKKIKLNSAISEIVLQRKR